MMAGNLKQKPALIIEYTHPSTTLHLPPSAEAKHIQGFVAQRHEPDYCIELPYM